MAILILLNDVDVGWEGLLVGKGDLSASDLGQSQGKKISRYLFDHTTKIDRLVTSPAKHVNSLMHRIRMSSPGLHLAKQDLYRIPAFEERDFGVLHGTRVSIASDIFSHTRILPEGGESVRQFRDRVLPALKSESNRDRTTLIVSHPFVCQLCMNALLSRNITHLSPFWISKKGSFAIFRTKNLVGELKAAHNALENKQYSVDEIYELQF
jgi:broad specificity phosphatase PhoE